MMTWVVMVFVLLSASVAQALLPGWPWLGQAKFPFLLAAVLYYALNYGPGVTVTAAFLAGLLQDALSPIPLGYSTFCFSIAGLMVGGVRKLVIAEALPTHLLFGAVGAAAVSLGLWGLLTAADVATCTVRWGLLKAAGSALLGMVAAPVVFAVAGRFDRIVGNVGPGAAEEEVHGIRGPA